MDVQHQTKHTNHSGHESGHAVHLCHRCGWPFPNPHPSAKHRRAHKNICGTIEGYTTLNSTEVVSDDEHHLDDEKDKTPSPKIEKKKSVGDSCRRFSRSEEDMFSDAVNEFSESGVGERSVSSKALDRDFFFSFKDAENGEKPGETEIKTVCDSSETESKLELSKSIDVMKVGDEEVQESRTPEAKELNVPETVTEEAESLETRASDTRKTTPEISASVVGCDDHVEQEKLEKLSGVGIGEKLDSATENEEIEQEKFNSDCGNVSEVAKESEIDQKKAEEVSQVIKNEKSESDHEHQVGQSVPILTEKDILVAPESEKRSSEQMQDVIKELNAPKLEACSNKQTQDVTDRDAALILKKDIGQKVSEPTVEEATGKPTTHQDSITDLSVDSGSHNSLEGNWGSVSVLSTASIDAETIHSIDKSKTKSVSADKTPEVIDPPSFMTLVEPQGKDQKPSSGQPKSEAPQAGWFPTLTNVSNESEGRKRNEEVIAKVTNWSIAGKHTMPLKNLLGEAKSPNVKLPEKVVEKDEGVVEKGSLPPEAPAVNQELFLSPPKLIEDGKKGKKVKGRGLWMPFVCCSSVNVN